MRRGNAVPAVVQVLAIVVAFLAGGVVGGLLWERWWTPPTGVALSGVLVLDGDGAAKEFSGTGLYVLVGLGVGVVLGLLTALACRRRELLAMVAAVLAAGLAAWVMAQVGHALGPPDPTPLAKGAEDLTEVVPDLRVHGLSPYLALPVGTLLGLMGEYFGESRLLAKRSPSRSEMDTLTT